MGHSHSHGGHSHGGHDHCHKEIGERRLFWAMLLTAGFMLAEVAGGIISVSLALIADAGPLLTDAAALGLAWGVFRLSLGPANQRQSYGFDRFQVLAAFVNGLALLLLVGWIMWEAILRVLEPSPVLAGPMLMVAILGLVVNIIAFFILHGASKDNLNIEGALLHVIGDMLGSVAAIIAAVVIMKTGWTPIDPILSLLVAALILKSGWHLVRRAAHILMEGTPDSLDVDQLKQDLVAGIDGLEDVHHVHVWLLTAERPLLTMHANIRDGADSNAILPAIKEHLLEGHGIDHSTIQIESGTCLDH